MAPPNIIAGIVDAYYFGFHIMVKIEEMQFVALFWGEQPLITIVVKLQQSQ